MKMLSLKLRKIQIIVFLLFLLSFVPFFATAITVPSKESKLNEYIEFVFDFALGFSVAVGIGALIYGGLVYITSGGGGGMERGKEHIISALAGIVLIAAAYMLLKTIDPDLIKTDFELQALNLQDLPENPSALNTYDPAVPPYPSSPIPGKSMPANDVASKANELSGKLSYQYGGDPMSNATDCSGAAQRLRMELGGSNPGRSSLAQLDEARASGNYSADLGSLQPGDIIIRTSYRGSPSGMHVGTYIGNGLVWNSTRGGFVAEPIDNFMSRGDLQGINKLH